MERGIETRDGTGQDLPQERISIPILRTSGGDNRSDAAVRREKPWEDLHEGTADLGIPIDTQTRGAETLVTQTEIDGIKRHQREEIDRGNLLEIVVERNHFCGHKTLQFGEDSGNCLLNDAFDGGATLLATVIGPSSKHLCMLGYDVIVAQDNVIRVNRSISTRLDVGDCESWKTIRAAVVCGITESSSIKTTDIRLCGLATTTLR